MEIPNVELETGEVSYESYGDTINAMRGYGETTYYAPQTTKKLPEIKNVELFDSSQPTIKVMFDDNTSTTCTLQEGDFFNLKGGIAWCIAKKVTDGKIFAMANKGEKIYKNSLKEKDKEKALQEMIAHKKQKRYEQKERRAARKRDEQIQLQAEAIARAMEIVEQNKRNNTKE